ncbi:MAG: AraC family transcriptional regulator [Armatimonadetes bacterium]|nr:AraC family transcriptional regulator [Armatimonadota bacterium]
MRTETRQEYQERIEAAIKFVLSRLDNPPSPVEIADHAGFSRFHFGRVFSMAVGEPLAEFVRRLRLERAAWQLENSDVSITEIAFEAGYESVEGFGRAFRDLFHVAPSDFRQQPARHEIQSSCEVHWCPQGRRSIPNLVISGECSMEARIEKIDDMTIVALRHIGPYYLIGEKFQKLAQWAMRHGVPITKAIGVWHDNPDEKPVHELRSDACLVVADGFSLPETDGLDLRVDKIQGGSYAVGTHKGSYEGLGDAWARFCGQALPKLGRQTGDAPPFELYLNDCMSVPVEELLTDLYVSLRD